jgi:hypothetical protein
MISYHIFHVVEIIRNANFLAIKFVKISHGLRLSIGSDDNFNIFGEVAR